MKSTVLAVFAAAICRSLVLSHDVGSGSSGLRPDYLPVCNPENYTQTPNPPFPSLPDQFSSILEFSSSLYQSSVIFSEHYDDPGNRGRVDMFSKNGQRDVVIYDYDTGEAFVIPDRVRGVACGVQPLTEPSAFVNASVYGFRYVDGKIHIGSVRELFKLTENQTGINCRQEEVRGIPCNCWQTCHVTENVSYVVTYYFASTTNWNYYFGGDTIPVRIDLCETSLDEDGIVNEDRHTYSFFRFHGGPDAVPDSAFAVPIGLPCLGRNAGRDLPDLPQYFSMLLEAADNPRKVNTRRVSACHLGGIVVFTLWLANTFSFCHYLTFFLLMSFVYIGVLRHPALQGGPCRQRHTLFSYPRFRAQGTIHYRQKPQQVHCGASRKRNRFLRHHYRTKRDH